MSKRRTQIDVLSPSLARRASVEFLLAAPRIRLRPATHWTNVRFMDKELILSEIRRTTQENGGKPLGHRAFASQTGIQQSDWGRYWPRFGDVVQAAGFAPNEMTRAYDRDFLYSKIVELTRELGHLPVVAGIRIKAQNDKTFPSEKTLRRLGPKHEVVDDLIKYCEKFEGHTDILAMCDAWRSVRRPTRSVSLHDSAVAPASFGFVYLMKSGRFYKIGHTVSVGQRHRQLAIQLPERLALVHEIRTDDPLGIEAYWHNRFASRRQNGEWFALTSDDVRAFKRRKFM